MSMKTKKIVTTIALNLALLFLAFIWLVPIFWMVLNSFSINDNLFATSFFPPAFSIHQYVNLLFNPGGTARFPTWFMNTFKIACFACVISTIFVLMVSYAFSCCEFRGRRGIMNVAVILGMFPGVLTMVAMYFILQALGMTDSHAGLVLVYSAGAGLGYLICKGFFDTVPASLREAAKLDGASEFRVFWQIVIPMSRPIIVYTVINAFLAPWMDFVMAKLMMTSKNSDLYTVAIGLFDMLDKARISQYFGQFCAGGVLVAIPIGILFVIMQKFYVEGITGGAVKG